MVCQLSWNRLWSFQIVVADIALLLRETQIRQQTTMLGLKVLAYHVLVAMLYRNVAMM
jgi:hypothetical protein